MSTRHNTGSRLWAWVLKHRLAILASGVVGAFILVTFVTTFRLYDERQARLEAIADQTAMNTEVAVQLASLAMATRDLATENCTGLNEANGSVRFILDSGLRLRSPTNPLSDQLRQAYIDAYRQLPERNCETGEKTFYDPPFPPTVTGGTP